MPAKNKKGEYFGLPYNYTETREPEALINKAHSILTYLYRDVWKPLLKYQSFYLEIGSERYILFL